MNLAKTNPSPRWTQAFQRLWKIHWIMAACFLAIYLIGIVMVRLPHEVVFRGSLYSVHKSIGVLILGLLLVRIFTLLQAFGKKYLKRRPKFTPSWIVATALHGLLYCFMLVVPISGIWLSNAGGHDVPFFFITLPNWFEQNRLLAELAENLHVWFAYTLLSLVGLHVVEQQQFIKRLWKRMTP